MNEYAFAGALGALGLAAVWVAFIRYRPLTVSEVTAVSGISPISAPPSVIPLPNGWRYATGKEVPKDALARAPVYLYHSSLGQFEDHETWGLLKEWHYDDHVSPGVKKWHPGVSVLLPVTVTL